MATAFNPTDPYTATTGTSSNYGTPSSINTGPSTVAGYNLPDITGVVNSQRANANTMFGNQNAQVGNYLSNFAGAINSQETQPAMWARLAQETGYAPAMRQATTLNNQLAAIPQTYSAATRGFDVNANQLDRIMNMQQWKLAPLAERATAQAQTAGQLMQGQIAATQAQQQKELLPYQAEQGFLADYLARQTSNFTQQNQAELQGLEYKMQTGATLSNEEQNRLNALRVAQVQYNQAYDVEALKQQNQLIPQGATYYNPKTGVVFNPFQPVTQQPGQFTA